jgi:hypothetical protein
VKTLKLQIELTYDDTVMHDEDIESVAWFHTILTDKTPGNLLLHSQEIGDEIGTVIVTKIEEVQP